MTIFRAVCLLLLLACGARARAADKPGDYAFHAPVAVVPGAPLQRLELPVAALVSLQQPGFADLRVHDADGQPQPIALLAQRKRLAKTRQTLLATMVLMGARGALTVTGVGLRIDPSGTARVVSIDGSVAAPSREAVVLGVLLDTAAAKGPATRLTLDAVVPLQQPVTFRIDASADLRAWQPVTDHVAYRSPGETNRETIALDPSAVRQRYLRVTWSAATRLLAPVTVTGAALTTTGDIVAPQLVTELAGATLADAHDLRFALPFASAVSALRIVPARDTVVPVRILGRSDPEQPWSLIAEGTAYRVTRDGRVAAGPAIGLSQRGSRHFRIEADKRTAGFAAVPRLELSFEPREIAVLLTGRAPYTLSAGLAGAKPVFLPIAALMAGTGDLKADALPLASVRANSIVARAVAADRTGGIPRTWILWAALAGGTLTLGVVAWLAARTPKQA